MTDRTKIEGLYRLFDSIFDTEKAKMSALIAREDQLKERLKALQAEPTAPFDPAQIAGADCLYEQWADQRRREIIHEQARLKVQIESARIALSKAFGRERAADAMLKQYQSDLEVRKKRQTF